MASEIEKGNNVRIYWSALTGDQTVEMTVRETLGAGAGLVSVNKIANQYREMIVNDLPGDYFFAGNAFSAPKGEEAKEFLAEFISCELLGLEDLCLDAMAEQLRADALAYAEAEIQAERLREAQHMNALIALEAGLNESQVARYAGVTRKTIRAWAGK